MGLLRPSFPLLFALAILSPAPAGSAPKKWPPKPTAKSRKPVLKDNKKKDTGKPKPRPAPKPPTTFQGEVVLVKAQPDGTGSVGVKHANGTGKTFRVTGSTQIAGATQALKALTKGSLVTVQASGSQALQINVTRLAPPPRPVRPTGTVAGKVTAVKSDAYGDTGSVTIQPARGKPVTLRVVNATTIDYKDGSQTIVHTLQGVVRGQRVVVRTRGKVALHIDVILRPKK